MALIRRVKNHTFEHVIQNKNKFSGCVDIYDALMPLHIISRVLAVSPYRFQSKFLKRGYERSIPGSIYSFLFIITFTAYYVFAMEERNRIASHETHFIVHLIDLFQLYSAVSVMTVCACCNIFKQNSLRKAVHLIAKTDDKMMEHGFRIEHRVSRNYIIGYTLFLHAVFAVMEYTNCSMFLRTIDTFSDMCLLMCYIPSLINGLVACQFHSYVLLLRQRFMVINSTLETLSSRQNSLTLCDLKTKYLFCKAREMHADLCCAGKLIEQSFSWQNLILITTAFISFTTHAFYCFGGLVNLLLNRDDADLYNTATTFIWTMLKFAQLLSSAIICCVAVNEINYTKCKIYKFDTSLSTEIRLFGQQILNWNFYFTACNIFKLDMTLFFSAVSSAMSYIIILLQLDLTNVEK